MPTELPKPNLIEHEGAFQDLLAELENHADIAVDTEADSFFSYHEKVCLIQITAGGVDYLLDPLADFDIAPLGAMFADPKRRKIFHDGEYDVLLFKRNHDFEFANLFDTRVAAAALGTPNPGLASVLEDHFGVKLDKSMQRSDWSERPLSQKQIDYARLDTHYLIGLMDEQLVQLGERELVEVVDGECRRLEQLDAPPIRFQPDDWVKLKGARNLSGQQRSNLRELFALRDRLSAERDVPPFRVMNNQALLAIAQAAPKSVHALGELSGVSPRQARRIGDGVMQALAEARSNGPINRLPQLPAKDGTAGMSFEELELFDDLKAWRRKQAERLGFDASLVLNRHALVRLAKDAPKDVTSLATTEGIVAWQVERFGEQLAERIARFRPTPENERGKRRRR
jgi:ribonuclease D